MHSEGLQQWCRDKKRWCKWSQNQLTGQIKDHHKLWGKLSAWVHESFSCDHESHGYASKYTISEIIITFESKEAGPYGSRLPNSKNFNDANGEKATTWHVESLDLVELGPAWQLEHHEVRFEIISYRKFNDGDRESSSLALCLKSIFSKDEQPARTL